MYHTLHYEDGITAKTTAVDNLYKWFGGDNPKTPVPHLGESCLFYQNLGPGNDEHLILILATPRQHQMAWAYGHQKQMMLDGMFGICSTCMLVFFLMVVDDQNIGVPLATIIFTPKKDAKAGHASYDGPLLARFLQHWKDGMGKNAAGEDFEIKVANTDNDPCEWHGLQMNWNDIRLILCMFHTWQSWRNGLTCYLSCVPKGEPRKHVWCHLGKFLMQQLKDITEYSNVIATYNVELEYFWELSNSSSTMLDKAKSKGGLMFLAYFKSYLALHGFWKSWSRAGIIEAARILQKPIDSIPHTTNHLESFNGRVKIKYFVAYQHSGRLPRLDAWVLLLRTRVMPDFFAEYDERRKTEDYYEMMRFAPASTGPDLSPAGSLSSSTSSRSEISIIPSKTKREKYAMISLTDEIEDSMLEELRSDDDSEADTTSEDPNAYLEEDHVLEGLGCHLVVEPNGEGSSFSTVDLPKSDNAAEDSHDNALDSSGILDHSLIHSSDSFPFPPAQPVAIEDLVLDGLDSESGHSGSEILAHLDIELIGLDPLQQKLSDMVLPSNSKVIAYQQVLAAEDHLLECLCTLLTISNSPDIQTVILPHLSPRIRSQLPSTLLLHSEHLELDISQAQTKENGPRQIPLMPQKKEHRKQSYSIR